MIRVEWANALRGFAALVVLFFHYYITFWVRQDTAAGLARREPFWIGDVGAPSFAKILNSLPLDFGALGVAIFFLLSGFVIAISLDRYNRFGFLIGRCLRLLPTYAAGYLVTCAVIFAVSDPQHELTAHTVLTGMVPGLSLILGTTVPGDGIVWTLIIELVFYAICLASYRTLTTRWQTILTICTICAVVQWVIKPTPLGTPIAGLTYIILLACPFLPVMLIGVVISSRHRGRLPQYQSTILILLLTISHFVLASTSAMVPTALLYRLTFLFAIFAFWGIYMIGDHWIRHPVADFFADISYPLYVVHPVLGYTLLSACVSEGIPVPLALLATTATAIAMAWVLHFLVEVPTHRLGQRWARSMSNKSVNGH